MINGVLTERTVKEVVPILQTNSSGLKQALEELVKQYKLKQDEMEKWKVCVPRDRLIETIHEINQRVEAEQRAGCPAAWAIEIQSYLRQPFDREGTRHMLEATWYVIDGWDGEVCY
jgi:hypothetical protein